MIILVMGLTFFLCLAIYYRHYYGYERSMRLDYEKRFRIQVERTDEAQRKAAGLAADYEALKKKTEKQRREIIDIVTFGQKQL